MADVIGVRPQLDGLRAVAMVGVLYVHFWNTTPSAEYVRVTLFLVISGFLITHILMSAKAKGGALTVQNFYIRRALRLFPALFVIFIGAWLMDADGFRASAAWHLLPTSNIYFSRTEAMRPWVVAHLWSLNLLEQFYLLWPLVILFLSEKALHVVVVLGIAGIAFLRANGDHLGVNYWYLTFVFSFDPILMGALAFLLQRHRPARDVMTNPATIFLALAFVSSPLVLWEDFGHSDSYRFLSQPAVAVLVVGAFQGYSGPVGWMLQSPPVRFIAKISYGVYVYHLLAWYAVAQYFPTLYDKDLRTFVVMSTLTIALATVSYYAIELPVSRWKDAFPVRKPTVAAKRDQLA